MSLHRIDDCWSNFFGIESTEFLQSNEIVVPHDYLKGYKGAWLFQHKQKTVISVEAKMVEQIRSRIKTLNSDRKDPFS
ncbi:MAG: hypothetical protein P1U56_18320 [Saprospiraceae bacterium]|nr:hypothetical protein [Saprospiraceae bacterium]